jgi:hypothetical protein
MNRIDQNQVSAEAAIRNERGTVLIMCLFLLVTLTFLGLQAILSSSTEVMLSANFKRTMEAFNSAEAGTAYVMKEPQQYLTIPAGGSGDSVPFPAGGVDLDISYNGSTVSSASGKVYYMAEKAPPVNTGNSMKSFNAEYFTVMTTGTGSLNSQSRHQVLIYSIVPGGS